MLIKRLSINQLHKILDLNQSNISEVNSLVRKYMGKDHFDLASNKPKLSEIVYSNLSYDLLSTPTLKKPLVSTIKSSDFIKLKEILLEHNLMSKDADPFQLIESNTPDATIALMKVLGVKGDKHTSESPILKPTTTLKQENTPFKSLKSYQLNVHEESQRYLSPPRGRVMICMPTGTGKTRTAMEVVSAWINENKNVLWLVNSVELMAQAYECFKQVYEHIGNGSVKVSLLGFGHDGIPEKDESPTFTIAGLQTLNRYDPEKLNHLSSLFDLIVFDEAHHVMAKTYKKLLESFLSIENKTRLLGLSATPLRSDDKESMALASFFHNNFIQLPPLKEDRNIIESLIDEDILAKPIWKSLDYEPKFALNEKDLLSLNRGNKISTEVLNKLASDFNRNYAILNKLHSEGVCGKAVIYFGVTKNQSKTMSLALRCLGVKAVHLDDSSTPNFRSRSINAFKSGEINVLCNYGILTTGFDSPKIDTVVLGRVSESPILINQMVGRGLRGKKLGGTETCKIIVPNDKLPNVISSVEEVERLMSCWAS